MKVRQRMVGLLLIAFALMLGARTSHGMFPGVKVSVERVDNQYVFSFRIGDDEAQISNVVVAAMQGGKRTADVCRVFAQHPRNPIQGRWAYGTAPTGFQKQGCRPLGPGSYFIEAIGAGDGTLEFDIDAKGAVRAVKR